MTKAYSLSDTFFLSLQTLVCSTMSCRSIAVVDGGAGLLQDLIYMRKRMRTRAPPLNCRVSSDTCVHIKGRSRVLYSQTSKGSLIVLRLLLLQARAHATIVYKSLLQITESLHCRMNISSKSGTTNYKYVNAMATAIVVSPL